ncbi:ImmA/IrrE family metallo-endopeptidase [Ruania zhangjianzhongii]|uniref:ImmA/IrrE family metallo-endopeptidase n=1 Tax=Ruania zhangjianzhongii TaxID=2603206 RepID=UPI001F3724EC|nr:ImmA/IrrE family metallo-endopeptidase [Ruania zhangjianzhongii]
MTWCASLDRGTDYSLTVGQRGIIVLNAIPNWFRSNWSLAHELGHLALGHHVRGDSPTTAQENAADQFAAGMLLPESVVRAMDWTGADESQLASFLWESGVSTLAILQQFTCTSERPRTLAAQRMAERCRQEPVGLSSGELQTGIRRGQVS